MTYELKYTQSDHVHRRIKTYAHHTLTHITHITYSLLALIQNSRDAFEKGSMHTTHAFTFASIEYGYFEIDNFSLVYMKLDSCPIALDSSLNKNEKFHNKQNLINESTRTIKETSRILGLAHFYNAAALNAGTKKVMYERKLLDSTR